jgi:hypothetical protein
VTDAELQGIEMRLMLECPAHLRVDLRELLAEVRMLRGLTGESVSTVPVMTCTDSSVYALLHQPFDAAVRAPNRER